MIKYYNSKTVYLLCQQCIMFYCTTVYRVAIYAIDLDVHCTVRCIFYGICVQLTFTGRVTSVTESIQLLIMMLCVCLYSIKDGEFRQYKGQRMESELVAFVREEMWRELEPLSWYRSPKSAQ